jgi:hypothetical protein
MPQWVFEFGSNQLDAVRTAVDRVIDCSSCAIESADELTVSLAKDVNSAYEQLRQGSIQSLILRPQTSDIRYILLLPPDPSLSLWRGIIEYTGADYGWIWERVLSVEGLVFACLGHDEGVELKNESLSVQTFPWQEWPLVVGAVREARLGQWVIHYGPEHV